MVAALLNINSLESLENSRHLGNIWENFIFTEYLINGLIAGKNLFYIRDKNGVEIDFVIEKDGKVILVEAKNSERPNPKKLNFSKIAPLFQQKVTSVVACGVEEMGMISLKDYSVYNPLYGFNL